MATPDLDPSQRPGFSELTHRRIITPEARAVGLSTSALYESRIKRPTPWMVQDGKVYVFNTDTRFDAKGPATTSDAERLPQLDIDPNSRTFQRLVRVELPVDLLAEEQISDNVARVILVFKRIEDKLPDFTGRSIDLYRDYLGINRSYAQWSREEAEHSNGASLILERTGFMTQEQLMADYYSNLEQTWELPFPTPREMTLYAYFQELLTAQNYLALRQRVLQEGATISAEILRLIAADESRHATGYYLFSRAFAAEDLEGTRQDTIHVASNFRMPAQHLMVNPRRDTVDIAKAGAISRGMVDRTLRKGLNGLGFIPNSDVELTMQNYWNNQNRLVKASR